MKRHPIIQALIDTAAIVAWIGLAILTIGSVGWALDILVFL